MIARFPDNEVFDFSIGYSGEFEIFEKKIIQNRKLKISKNPQRNFVRTIGRKSQEKFQNLWLRFVGGVAF